MVDNTESSINTISERRQLLKLLGAGSLVGLAGCAGGSDNNEDTGGEGEASSEEGGSTERSYDTLRVGAYGPLTGPTANIGEAKRTGWEVVAEFINENGGINGAEIELFFADSESEPGQGRSAVNRLIQEQDIDILGGGYHSDVSLSVVELANENDLPFIIDESVSGAINDAILEQNMETVFKTAPPSQAYAVAWGNFVKDLQESEIGYFPFEDQTIAMIAEDTSYGISVMEQTAEQVQDAGWEVVSQDEVPLDETDFTSLLARIRSQEPDVVWAVQTNSAGTGALVSQFSELDFGEAHFFHNFGLSVGQALEQAGAGANGAFTITHPAEIPALISEKGWDEAWNESTELDISGNAATSMTNIEVIARMVESAGGVEQFVEMSRTEWEEHVIGQDPITGGVGYIDFQENHQAAWGGPDTIPSIGYQAVDGELNFVWPFELAESEIDTEFY